MQREDITEQNEKEKDLSSSSYQAWPYRNAEEVRQAAQSLDDRRMGAAKRSEVLARLRASGPLAAAAVPILMETFHKHDIGMRHEILDFFQELLKKGVDLRPAAEGLSKYLADPNFGLREKVASLLIRMGPAAEEAVTRALSNLRNPLPDIRLASVRLLAAIGPSCAKVAVPKLTQALAGVNPTKEKELHEAIEIALFILDGRTPDNPDLMKKVRESPRDLLQSPAETSSSASLYPNMALARILVVEDTINMRKLLVKNLSKYCAAVEEAGDGVEAWEQLEKAAQGGLAYDLIVLDLMMPRMNGLEFLRRLRTHPTWKGTKVLVISARKEREIITAAAKLGIVGYIAKPYGIPDVLKKIEESLGQQPEPQPRVSP